MLKLQELIAQYQIAKLNNAYNEVERYIKKSYKLKKIKIIYGCLFLKRFRLLKPGWCYL